MSKLLADLHLVLSLQSMDFVIRFNKLQSFKCGDKFDVWASRHGDAVTTRYWGIGDPFKFTTNLKSALLVLLPK